MRAGQFSIFGAIAEIIGHGFTRTITIRSAASGRENSSASRGCFGARGLCEQWTSRRLVGFSTGLAQEMQKAVGSRQWPEFRGSKPE
jgi:hypothetical protein